MKRKERVERRKVEARRKNIQEKWTTERKRKEKK